MSSVQCNGQLLRSPDNGRIDCPQLTSWIAEAGERCRLKCDSGYTPSVSQITCYDYGWSIPSNDRVHSSKKVACVSGGATTMLIIGLLVGGLILICIIAFAYAKFSDRRDKSKDDESDSGKGSAAAKRAALEETIDDHDKKKGRGRKVYENPTNKIKGLVGANMIDPYSAFAPHNRSSPESQYSGFPLMMSSGPIGPTGGNYEYRNISPVTITNYESFALPKPLPQSMGLQRHQTMSPMSHMTYQSVPAGGFMGPNRFISSQSFSAYDQVNFAPMPMQAGAYAALKSKSYSPDGYPVST